MSFLSKLIGALRTGTVLRGPLREANPRATWGLLKALFGAGEQGLHYDISDLSSLYQDAAGTTPAVVGQPVGLVLDKRFGLERGAELVTNGGFDSAAGWTLKPNASIADGRLTISTVGNGNWYDNAATSVTITAGKTYQYEIDVESASDFLWLRLSSNTSDWRSFSAQGVYKGFITAASSSSSIFLEDRHNVEGTAVINSISVREIPGNHATQATTASKPILARHPVGGRRNLLTYTEDFGNAGWSKFGTGGTTTPVTLSNGLPGFRIAATANREFYSLTISSLAAGTYTLSGFGENSSGSTATLQVFGTSNIIATGEFSSLNRAALTFSHGGGNIEIRVGIGLTANATGSIDISGLTLETGSTATDYQKVVSEFDVTEAGVADCYYLRFDGVDDFLVTGSINFTSTDEMSVIAGVRKLSDAALGMVAELSTTANTNGAFYLTAPRTEGLGNYGVLSAGTGASNAAATTASDYPAPHSAVLGGVFDISADQCALRVNGSQAASSAIDQGTGNYGNYPLYIGRRAGSSLPFNGNLYSLIVRGKLTAGDDLTKTEEYVAEKTGVTL